MRIELPPDPTSAAMARQAVRDACAGIDVDLDLLVLCTSELVANAVLHGMPPLQLAVVVGDEAIRVEVRDGSSQLALRRRPVVADTLSGRGLGILEAAASEWGSEPTGTGKVTWFDLRR